MDLPNLWLWSGLRIGPQLMDGLSAGRSPPRSKEEEEEEVIYPIRLQPTVFNNQQNQSTERQPIRNSRYS